MSADLDHKHFDPVRRHDDLPTRINKLHVMVQQDAISAIERARLAGELLIEAKKTVGHGNWLAWLGESITFSAKTASNYMRVARSLPKLEDEDRQRVADMSFRDLLSAMVTDTNRLSKLPAPAAKVALETAESQPLRRSVTLATNAERVRRTQERHAQVARQSTANPTSTSDFEPAFTVRLPQWRVDLRDKVIALVRAAMAEHGLTAVDAIEALQDAYCELQDGTLP